MATQWTVSRPGSSTDIERSEDDAESTTGKKPKRSFWQVFGLPASPQPRAPAAGGAHLLSPTPQPQPQPENELKRQLVAKLVELEAQRPTRSKSTLTDSSQRKIYELDVPQRQLAMTAELRQQWGIQSTSSPFEKVPGPSSLRPSPGHRPLTTMRQGSDSGTLWTAQTQNIVHELDGSRSEVARSEKGQRLAVRRALDEPLKDRNANMECLHEYTDPESFPVPLPTESLQKMLQSLTATLSEVCTPSVLVHCKQ